jgi:FixJ family two-component response regulator
MPETDGRVLGQLLAERYPCLPVAYMSAHSINDVFHRGSPGPNLPFLSKPFSPETLLALVKTVLDSERSGAREPAKRGTPATCNALAQRRRAPEDDNAR